MWKHDVPSCKSNISKLHKFCKHPIDILFAQFQTPLLTTIFANNGSKYNGGLIEILWRKEDIQEETQRNKAKKKSKKLTEHSSNMKPFEWIKVV
jgi:hypothetical protein